MNTLERLTILVTELSQLDLTGQGFKEAIVSLKTYRERFELLLTLWMEDAKMGDAIPIEAIESILQNELKSMRVKFKHRPNPKMPNTYDTLNQFYLRLNDLKFELDKRKSLVAHSECYCALRQKNRIKPDFNFLTKYGSAILYHEDDDFMVFECRLCKSKWIDATVPGMLSLSNTWVKWNPKEYLLRDKF